MKIDTDMVDYIAHLSRLELQPGEKQAMTEELERIVSQSLPLHVVEKKIPYLDEVGEPVKPQEPNGYKFENLILDMIHQMGSCLPFEVVREKEFAPIKNKTGIDSVESARELLRQNGVTL